MASFSTYQCANSFSPMVPSPNFQYISCLDPSFDTLVPSSTYQLNPIQKSIILPMLPPTHPFLVFLDQEFNQPASSPDPAIRRILRHGCRLCSGVHFDRKHTKGGTMGLQHHITSKHPEYAANWETQAYEWGYRVKYKSKAIVDEPFAGSASSTMTPKGAKGGMVAKKGRCAGGTGTGMERRELDEKVNGEEMRTQDQVIADEDDTTRYLDPALFIKYQ